MTRSHSTKRSGVGHFHLTTKAFWGVIGSDFQNFLMSIHNFGRHKFAETGEKLRFQRIFVIEVADFANQFCDY